MRKAVASKKGMEAGKPPHSPPPPPASLCPRSSTILETSAPALVLETTYGQRYPENEKENGGGLSLCGWSPVTPDFYTKQSPGWC